MNINIINTKIIKDLFKSNTFSDRWPYNCQAALLVAAFAGVISLSLLYFQGKVSVPQETEESYLQAAEVIPSTILISIVRKVYYQILRKTPYRS